MMVKQIILGRNLSAFTKKKGSDILTETKDSLHFTIYVPYVQQKKTKKVLCVH